jgi:act minimal PKS chain-length factor (CLF/KS beta)
MTVRAVVTGLGIVAPSGIGAAAFWASACAGRSALGPITRFDPAAYPVQLAGEVTDFDAAAFVPAPVIPQTDRFTQFGLAAAAMALADAEAESAELPEYETAVVTGASSGGTEFGQHEIERLWREGPGSVGAYQSIAWFYAATTGQVSIRHKFRGPCGVLATEQAAGLDALCEARRVLRSGVRLVLAGGTDASLCPYGLVAQLSTGLLSTASDPAAAYQPFSLAARGYVPGEGGAMMVIERADDAVARGITAYGEIAGYAATFDPPPGSGRAPGLVRAARLALADAGLAATEVDVVFADAMGLPSWDHAEAAAITAVFGPYGVPVTAPKAGNGRSYAGGGALDVACALLSIKAALIPPTPSVASSDPRYAIDLVTGSPRKQPVRAALVLARGYGGFNSAIVVRAPSRADQDDRRLGTMPSFTLDDLSRILRDSAGVALDPGNDDTPLADLGYESLAVLELAARVKNQYGVVLPEETVDVSQTPREILTAVNERLGVE